MHWPARFFPLSELLQSEDAETANLDNLPTVEELQLLKQFVVVVLDPIRESFGEAIDINSGFRDPQVNQLVGGVESSDHRCQIGAAADIRPSHDFSTERCNLLYRLIVDSHLPFDQLIHYGNRVHIGWRPGNNRRELKKKINGVVMDLVAGELDTFPRLSRLAHTISSTPPLVKGGTHAGGSANA